MIYETIRQAFQNIWSNKFRTLLTMLGIIIGVMAVIVIVGLGNGMTQSIKDGFADMGTNILSVQIMDRGSRNVSVDAVYDIVESHPDLFTSVSPTGTVSGTVKVGTDSYSNTTVKGVSEVYFDILGYTIDEGRLLNYVDLENNKNGLRRGCLHQPRRLWRKRRGPDHQDRLYPLHHRQCAGSQGHRPGKPGRQQR